MSIEDEEYVPISLGKIQPDSKLAAPVFIALGGKFIKFKNEGDIIPSEKYDYFMSKNVQFLFVVESDKDKFESQIKLEKEALVDALAEDCGKIYLPIIQKAEEIKEACYQVFSEVPLTVESVSQVQEVVTEFISELKQKGVPHSVLMKMAESAKNLAEHSMATAHYAVMIGLILGQSDQVTLETLFQGALFHDYGKIKIPTEIMNDTKSYAYEQAIQKHPINGAGMLSEIVGIKPEVLKIVEQHHERFDGKGFPKGLKGTEIHTLSNTVAMANRFENILFENKNRGAEARFRAAIKEIELDNGRQFNPSCIERTVESLKLAKGFYYDDY